MLAALSKFLWQFTILTCSFVTRPLNCSHCLSLINVYFTALKNSVQTPTKTKYSHTHKETSFSVIKKNTLCPQETGGKAGSGGGGGRGARCCGTSACASRVWCPRVGQRVRVFTALLGTASTWKHQDTSVSPALPLQLILQIFKLTTTWHRGDWWNAQ